MNRAGPQPNRVQTLSEACNDCLGGREPVVSAAIDDIRTTALEWVAAVPEASMQSRRLLAVIIMAGCTHGLLAATAREFDMPLNEVEEVFNEMLRSDVWRRET